MRGVAGEKLRVGAGEKLRDGAGEKLRDGAGENARVGALLRGGAKSVRGVTRTGAELRTGARSREAGGVNARVGTLRVGKGAGRVGEDELVQTRLVDVSRTDCGVTRVGIRVGERRAAATGGAVLEIGTA